MAERHQMGLAEKMAAGFGAVSEASNPTGMRKSGTAQARASAALSERQHRFRRAPLSTSLALALAVFAFLGGCSSDNDRETLWVFAASSLTDAFTEIAVAFENANPDIEVQTQFAGSSQLAAQIAAGAPADVFASANEAVMETLLPGGELAGTEFSQPATFARNELVIAVPAGNPKGISSIADLAGNDLLLAICNDGVPCGTLAHEAATAAGIELRPDTEEANVRAVLAKLLLGEVDAGLVYRSDVVAVTRSTTGGNSAAREGSAKSSNENLANSEAPDTQSSAPVTAIPISPVHTNNYPIACCRRKSRCGRVRGIRSIARSPANPRQPRFRSD